MQKIVLGFLFIFITSSRIYSGEPPHLLIKISSKESPEQLFSALDQYYEKISKEIPFKVHVTWNIDLQNINADESSSINKPDIIKRLEKYPNLAVTYSGNKSKIESFNDHIDNYIDWFDILLVASDGYVPAVRNYDQLISDTMRGSYPDYDGVINFYGGVNAGINYSPVIGKKYYQRFGYIYHPSYQIAWHDQEFACVSRILAKETLVNKILLIAEKPAAPTSKIVQFQDQKNFNSRRLNTFEINEATLRKIFTKDWSILICTLQEREKPFGELYKKLSKQIKDNHLDDRVEILFFKDNRENSVGLKRSSLINQSKGMYVNFIDDDDEIHDDYVKMIHEKLRNSPDSVSLVGLITFNGKNPALFIHSIKYKTYFQENNTYYRPPNHLNTIKRSIASQFLFPNISYGEDTDWAMRIAKSELIKTEEEITTPYYFYKYVEK